MLDRNATKENLEVKGFSPDEVVKWALANAKRPVITTNFRPYEAAILHLLTRALASIKVLWCDTGYNTFKTYEHAHALVDLLELNIQLYVPLQTSAERDVRLGLPNVDDPLHEVFSEEVKLEPFRRAMAEHKPDVWFTNLRIGQSEFRNALDIVSYSKEGVMKVSPFYHYSDKDLDGYLHKHHLPNEFTYFDPTKVLSNRECGIHN